LKFTLNVLDLDFLMLIEIQSGQVCMSTDQIILHSSIASPFITLMKSALRARFPLNSPTPTLIFSSAKSRIQSVVSSTLESGAHVILDLSASDEKGIRFGPLVLGNVSKGMTDWQEEAFAPVVGCMTFTSLDDAIEIANGSVYGLSAAVFTRDLRKGLAVAKRIHSGAVHINSMTFQDEAALPFGGVKNSGWGRFNSSNGMEEFLMTKTITWDD